MFTTVFSTHRHPASTNPAHPVQCPFRFVILATKALRSQASRQTCLHRKYNKRPGTYAGYSCVWRLGCFAGAWRRGSWHFQVASLHLQLIMNLCPLHYFSFLSKRSGWRMPPAERGALHICMNYIHAYIHTRTCLEAWRSGTRTRPVAEKSPNIGLKKPIAYLHII